MCEEESEGIICRFCYKVIYSEDTGWKKECRHYVSREDDYVDWKGILPINDVQSIFEKYIYDEGYVKKLKSLYKDLKIYKYLSDVGDLITYEFDLMDMSNEIWIEKEEWDTDRPGGSGTYKTLYIRDRRKIRWIVKELNILLERLIEFDRENKQILYKKNS